MVCAWPSCSTLKSSLVKVLISWPCLSRTDASRLTILTSTEIGGACCWLCSGATPKQSKAATNARKGFCPQHTAGAWRGGVFFFFFFFLLLINITAGYDGGRPTPARQQPHPSATAARI